MRFTYKIITLMILGMALVYSKEPLSFATWNLRYANAKDSLNGDGWAKRAPQISKLVQYHGYDILALQEIVENDSIYMISTLHELLEDYEIVGNHCDSCRDYNPIMYNKKRVSLVDAGVFYFSEYPDSASKSWDSYLYRYCAWAEFHVSQDTFFVFNVHWDHKGIEARKQSAKLTLEKIPEIAEGSPVIYAGDINCEAKYDCYKMLEANYWRDARTIADYVYLADSSFNQFKVDKIGKKTLDVIFVTPSIKVYRYGIQRELYYDGKQWRTPSDHNPVVIQFEVR